jgi:proteasome lid subunit RPN8/RPN11
MRFLQRDVLHAARMHAMRAWPQESCGGVTSDGYVPFINRAREPDKHFECSDQVAPLLLEEQLLALIHSHPDGAFEPSEHDQAQQIVMDIPWGIVLAKRDAALDPYFWGEMLEPPPLEGRDFRFGPSGTDGRGDCAALVRDWYRLKRDIRLPEFPRADGFWKLRTDKYRRSMAEAGFQSILLPKHTEPAVGDIAMIAVLSPHEPNHAAIYVGGGLILHHFAQRLSRTEPLMRWRNLITNWYRHAP